MKRRGWRLRAVGLLGGCALVGSLLAGPAAEAAPTTGQPGAGQLSAGEPSAGEPNAGVPSAAQPKAGDACAVGDLQPITVPAPSPVPEHKPGEVTIGGDALAGNTLAVAPGAPPLPADLAAASWLVADVDTGEVIGACGAHRMLAPASVQKVLLTLTVLPKLNPADVVLVTPEDLDFGAEWDSKTVPLQPGQAYRVEDLFLGLLLRSGNDAANALARIAGGDRGVAGTIADMNAEAHRLGAWDTHAETPSGLDGPGQVTSAYDLALIFRAAYEHEEFRRWVRTMDHQLTEEMQIQHDNWQFLEYPGSLGGKAGFTDIARHTWVGAAERDGRRLVATVLGGEILPARAWQQSIGLLEWGFAQPRGTSVGHLVEPGEAQALVDARRHEAPTAVVIEPVPPSGGTPTALFLAAGIGGAALASLALIVVAGRRRRTALATTAVATAPAPDPPAPNPVLPDPPTPDVPMAPPGPEPPPRPFMGQPPPN